MINPESIKPVEFKVFIKVEEVKDQTSGGMFLPESVREREQTQHDKGILVAASSMAFSDWPKDALRPKIGDTVLFNKYAGALLYFQNQGEARIPYRLCNDKDICAIVEEA